MLNYIQKMDSPFFSIIIPTYNRGNLLRKSIESVIAQSYPKWELLIVDDGSTDNTKQVVEAYADKRIKYIYQQNAERSAARNRGIENAQGLYIGFLDSDDYYTPDRLLKLHSSLSAMGNPVGFFYTGILIENEKGIITERSEMNRSNMPVFDFVSQATIFNQQVCVHSTVLQKHKYNPGFTIGEDMELWLRVAADYEPTFLPGQSTFVLVEHDDRSVNVKRYNSYTKQLQMLQFAFTPPHPGSKISAKVKSALLSKAYFGIAKFCIYNGERLKAANMLFKTLLADTGSKYAKYRLNILLHVVNPFISIKKTEKLLSA